MTAPMLQRDDGVPAPPAEPDVTVVIPCYNYANYLPQAVDSVLGQQGVGLEVIIVDDKSTDDSRAVAEEFARRDGRVRVIAHEVNRGHIRTYNDGLAEAKGFAVALLSADDVLAPGSLGRALAVLRAHPEVGLVYGYAQDFCGRPPRQLTARVTTSVWSGRRWIARLCARGSNLIVNPEAVMRRSVLEQVGLYDPRQPQAADMELWMRAAAIADVARVNGPQQAFYRVHGGNMHLNAFDGIVAEIGARRAAFDAFFSGEGSGLRDADGLRRAAHRALAHDAMRRARLLEHSESAEARDLAAALFGFAYETDPVAVRSSRLINGVLRAASASPLLRRVLARVDALRWALAWRRWRRWGL